MVGAWWSVMRCPSVSMASIWPLRSKPDGRPVASGQPGEAHVLPIQDNNLTSEVLLRRSILQSTLRQKYRSTGEHNSQRGDGPKKGLYRLHPIALPVACFLDLDR